MTKEGSAKIVNYITIRTGSLMLRRGYMTHNSEYPVCIIFYSINIHHIDCYCIKYKGQMQNLRVWWGMVVNFIKDADVKHPWKLS